MKFIGVEVNYHHKILYSLITYIEQSASTKITHKKRK